VTFVLARFAGIPRSDRSRHREGNDRNDDAIVPSTDPGIVMRRSLSTVETRRGPRRQPAARRGLASMELAMTLPLLMLLLLAICEFSMLFLARGEVVEACREAARVAALPGSTPDVVEGAVRKVLRPGLQGGMSVDMTDGAASGEVVAVVLRVPMMAAAPDLLWPVGYSVKDQWLVAESRVLKE
jgi:hypothetical protein